MFGLPTNSFFKPFIPFYFILVYYSKLNYNKFHEYSQEILLSNIPLQININTVISAFWHSAIYVFSLSKEFRSGFLSVCINNKHSILVCIVRTLHQQLIERKFSKLSKCSPSEYKCMINFLSPSTIHMSKQLGPTFGILNAEVSVFFNLIKKIARIVCIEN